MGTSNQAMNKLILAVCVVAGLTITACAMREPCDTRTSTYCFRHDPFDWWSHYELERNPPNEWPYTSKSCRGLTRSDCLWGWEHCERYPGFCSYD